jgi:hypothetical protein
MQKNLWAAALLLMMVLPAMPSGAQDSAERTATRAKLAPVLTRAGQRSDVNTTFTQSTKNPYNFIGTMRAGMVNAQFLEIVISVTANSTIGFRVYPHYNDGYINLGKAKDTSGLMRRLLYLTDQNFLYWGADDGGDVFSGYTFTLESGFPEDAITIVLRSIANTDKYVGTLRPFIDGTTAR